MSSHSYPQLSLLEYVGLGLAALTSAARMVWNIFKLAPYGLSGTWPAKRVIGLSFVRSVVLSTRQRHFVYAKTGEAFHSFCQSIGVSCESEELNCGPKVPLATLHTARLSKSIGTDEAVMLYIHGGGYGNPLSAKPMHVFVDAARAAGAGQLIALEYTVTPALKYPGQLVQAAASLRCLLNDRGIRPDQIIIAGDSAGGNLIMSLLAHIQSHHPDAPEIQGLSKKDGKSIKGVLMLSPWVSTSYTAPTYKKNGGVDLLDAEKMSYFTDLWEPKEEPWASPATSTTADFWKGLPVEKILMTVGTWECYYDDIVKMSEIMIAGGVDLTLATGKAEVHVQPMVDVVLGLAPTGTAASVLAWSSKL